MTQRKTLFQEVQEQFEKNKKARDAANIGLSDVLKRPEVKGLYYNGQTLRLDGYSWEACRFDNCILEILSTSFELKNCIIDNSNQIRYGDDLKKVIKLFNSRQPRLFGHFPAEFVPDIATNTNAITIQDERE